MKQLIYSYVANNVFTRISLDEIADALVNLRRPWTILNTLNNTEVKNMLKTFNKKYTKNTINCDNLTKIEMINNIVSLVKNKKTIKKIVKKTNKKIVKKTNKKYKIDIIIDCPEYLEYENFHSGFDCRISIDISEINKNKYLANFTIFGEIIVETTNNGSDFYCLNRSLHCVKECSKKDFVNAIKYYQNQCDPINLTKFQEKAIEDFPETLYDFIGFIKDKVEGKNDNDFEYYYDFKNYYVKPKK